MGLKLFASEFISYYRMTEVTRPRDDASVQRLDITRRRPLNYINPRSEMITTVFLCGYSNMVASGIMSGLLSK